MTGNQAAADVEAQSMASSNPEPKPSSSKSGLRALTITFFCIQVLFFAGTIVGWVFTIRVITSNQKYNLPADNPQSAAPSTMMIFIHAIFGVVVLIQLFLLERRVYWMRVERYAYKHQNETLPTIRDGSGASQNGSQVAFAPWNRPPVPTYASVLVESGISTGDVEDNIIAIAPPPAYGNTKSTKSLLLGHLTNSMRRARPVSSGSQISIASNRPRPMSFVGQPTTTNSRGLRDLVLVSSRLEPPNSADGVVRGSQQV